MRTGLLRNYAAMWVLIDLGFTGVFVWEAFRTTNQIFRIEMVVLALVWSGAALMWLLRSRNDARRGWPTTTPSPRAAIAIGLVTLALGGYEVWALINWGDVFYLICGAGFLAMGLWYVALGVNTLRHRSRQRSQPAGTADI
ncbi:hypothetical protein [Mycobacterium avium]|nr:hypothetical protein [Mycobacterium avium]QWY65437.1 hypothetical protein BJP78_27655 [Mycobacterium avium subsp. hominissuis]